MVGVVPHLKKVTPKVCQAFVTLRNFTSLLLFQMMKTAETSIMYLEIILMKKELGIYRNTPFYSNSDRAIFTSLGTNFRISEMLNLL